MPPIENRLLVHVKFAPVNRIRKAYLRLTSRLKKSTRYTPTQGKPSTISVVIKNIGESVFEGANARNATIVPVPQTMADIADREFLIEPLSPGASQEIEIDRIETELVGLAWISFEMVPRNQNAVISSYQKGSNDRHIKYRVPNAWGNSFTIASQFESSQHNTNLLIAGLTILTFVDAVWGLKNVLIGLVKATASSFQFVATLLTLMVK